jgi:bifunctional non-homologous end joining protein LigD
VKLPRIQPIAPKRIQAPFDHADFLYEVKMDGWRCLAYIENGQCRLISRKQNQFKSFSRLAASVAKLKVQNAIIDGEVVCLDKEGKSVFLDLMRRISWVKVLNPLYSQMRGREEMFENFRTKTEPVSAVLNAQ